MAAPLFDAVRDELSAGTARQTTICTVMGVNEGMLYFGQVSFAGGFFDKIH